MRSFASYLRVVLFLLIGYLLIEYTVEVKTGSVFTTYPLAWLVLGIAGLFAIAVEFCIAALQNVLFKSLDAEAKERYLAAEKESRAQRFVWFKKTYHKLVGRKPLDQEDEIVLDHDYDGIKELDNNLPPWWIYLFYATILFAGVYLVRFHIFQDYNQIEEYEAEVVEAKIAIAEYKKTAKNLVDVNTVELLTEASDLAAGKNIFQTNCAACHKPDGGGGIGPNLTDKYWILGGGIKNVFKTVTKGGRSSKGMVAWEGTLKPVERAQVASYVISLQGTTPAEPKEPQGDLWVEEGDAPKADHLERAENTTSLDTIKVTDEI
ncbi:cbb3-type cytochrome c oxidase N-terminal domain-containing protein [Mesonia aestuariivivens]|uniref:C-type cytochrome n=1 Tax=Mesonia aestuariivivens TaxID=2796128 RepID=A0ABS6W2Y1_9FLAO|nr:cbb3-type cytochrome c oxidase N-terminal domain-containing protein [Mesonia aestuariivivens]MBW2962074.1 c-type cytochrome [Mesonia aestuariivivens]